MAFISEERVFKVFGKLAFWPGNRCTFFVLMPPKSGFLLELKA